MSTSVDAILKKYLTDRGMAVDADTLSRAGIEFAGPYRCREALGLRPEDGDKRIGIIFHYPDSTYSVVRWFGKYIGPFGTVIDRKVENPTGRPLEAYKSPLCDWSKYEEGTLYVCESALKALVVSRAGYYAVAGSGVWGLCPKEELLLPEELRAGTRKVVILFDNDWKRNANVRASIRRLGNRLKERWPGVDVVHGQIPDPPSGSVYCDVERGKSAGIWGVDDAIATLGELRYEECGIEPTERELVLDEFNERYAVCSHPPCIIAIGTGHKYSRADFTGLLEANRKVWNDDKPVEVSKLWLGYEDRTSVAKVDYVPGGERIVPGEYYNEWRDDGPVATDGSVEPFLDVYKNAIPDENVRGLLFKSVAWMLQNRGTKLDKSFILVGRQVGTGKSLLAKTFGTILGASNYASIGVEDFSSDFNSAFAAKELVLVDDLHRMGPKEVAKLKRYTTADKIVVNAKNVRQYEIRNTAVFIITTNEYAAVAMDDVERRNLVVAFDPLVHYATGDRWWGDYLSWLDNGGYGKIRAWLENMDLSDFDPHYMPPMTETKKKMVALGRSDYENVVLDLWENPDGVLGATDRCCFTTEELYFIVYGERPQNAEVRKFGMALGNKFNYVCGGKLHRFYAGKNPTRMWAIRDRDKIWDIDDVKEDVRCNITLGNGDVTV
jgi:hypothetical protein